MPPTLYVLIGILGGALIAGVIVFFLQTLKYAREIKSSVDQLKNVLQTLSKDNTLAESLGSFREMVSTGKSLGVKVEKLTGVIDQFYQVALRADQNIASGHPPAPTVAEPGSSEFYPYDEGRMAAAETQRNIRASGVRMPPDEEIPIDKATGAQV